MSNRLTHSPGGYRRRLQIGAAEIVLVSEGKTDRYFYSRLLQATLNRFGREYAFRTGKELPGGSGGKPALLSYHDYLRRRQSLVTSLQGKTTLIVFLLDKDLDDRTRRLRRSGHVFYTAGYDFEHYVFLHGDLIEASAAATGADHGFLTQALPSADVWLDRALTEWKEWVTVCVYCVVHRISKGGNYGVTPSPVHHKPYNGLDANRYALRLSDIQATKGMSAASFQRSWKGVVRFVDSCYRRGFPDRVFKGKWLAWLLAHDLTQVLSGRDVILSHLESRLPHHLAMTVNYDAPWADNYKARLRSLAESAGLA